MILKPEDITKYSFLGCLKMNLQGDKGILSSSVADIESNGYSSSLWLLDAESETLTALDYGRRIGSYSWLGDDSVIFTSSGDENDEEWVKRGEIRTVVYSGDLEGNCSILARIPLKNAAIEGLSGGKILLSSFHDNRRPNFESLDEDERKNALMLYAREGEWEECTESPFWRDGKNFVDGKRTRLFVYDIESRDLSPITPEWFDTLTFRVDKKGERIAIVGELFERRMARMKGVFLYDVKAQSFTELMPDKGFQVSSVEFVGDYIFACAIPWTGYGRFPNHDLYRIDLKSGKYESVYKHEDEDNGFKAVNDTRLRGGYTMYGFGDALYYITSRDDNTVINKWIAPGEKERLTGLDFNPEFIALSSGGKLFSCGFGENRPQELYVVENGEKRRISSFNSKILSDYTPVVPRSLSFINSDGVRIDGFVIPPRDFERDRKYPGILEIHGGPRAMYTNSYMHEMQMLSSNGYFVFFCNPRGSASRGEAFSKPLEFEGKEDFQDLMEFTDKVLKEYPELDKERLGVTGGSFGGFMTNWIIGHTDRFKAAASCRSIANNVGNFGVSDETNWRSPVTVWEDPEPSWEGSPIKYFRNIKTPTIFLQSFEDYRCPISEAVQMYTALQILGVDTKLCLFRGDCHELSRSGHPRNRVRRLSSILSWMDKYLKAY